MAQTDMLAALMSLLGGGDGELRRPPQGNGPMPNRISPMQPAPGTSYSPQGVGDFMMDPQGMLAGDAKPNPMKQALDGYAAQMAQGGDGMQAAHMRDLAINDPSEPSYNAPGYSAEAAAKGRAGPNDEAMMKYVGDNVGGGETADDTINREERRNEEAGGYPYNERPMGEPGKFKEKRKAFPGDELDQDSKDEDMQHPGDRWPYRR